MLRDKTIQNMRKYYSSGYKSKFIDEMYFMLNTGRGSEEQLNTIDNLFYNNIIEEWQELIGDKSVINLIKKVFVKVYIINDNESTRLATINEIEQGIEDIEVSEIKTINKELFDKMIVAYGILNCDIYLINRTKYREYVAYGFNGNNSINIKGLIEKHLIDIVNDINEVVHCVDSNFIDEIKQNNHNINIEYKESELIGIKEDIDIKTIIFNVLNRFSKDDKRVKIVNAIIYKAKTYNKGKIGVEDKQKIRRIYKELIKESSNTSNEIDESVKKLCDELEAYRSEGVLEEREFCFKIVSTIKKDGYKKCSEKQMNIISEAIIKAKKKLESEQKEEFIESDNSNETNLFDINKI